MAKGEESTIKEDEVLIQDGPDEQATTIREASPEGCHRRDCGGEFQVSPAPAQSRFQKCLDWLDGRDAVAFLAILYVARWVVLLPTLFKRLFDDASASPGQSLASVMPHVNPVVLFVYMIVIAPLFETLLECAVPYALIAAFRGGKGNMPPRPWSFVLASGAMMALLHPVVQAIVPSLITGSFLAYVYAHFARKGHGPAIMGTTIFHGAINVVGWGMIVLA